MTDGMERMRVDARQSGAWLMANRATPIAVGLTWLGMIVCSCPTIDHPSASS